MECPAEKFDPFSDAYQRDPAASVAWARSERPVFYAASIGYWVVTRYADVHAVFRDHVTFSPSIALAKLTATSAEAARVLESYGYDMRRTLVNEDEPDHRARRRLLAPPFTPEAMAGQEPVIRRLTRQRVDEFIDRGRVDLVEALLWEVPLLVALHFLGVPEEDVATLRRYAIAHTVNTWGRPDPDEQVRLAHAVGRFWQFSGEILDALRADPSGPGWMPYSIRMQAEHPEIVTDSYLHSMMMAGIVAAHETTTFAAANAFRLLLSRRSVWEELCSDAALIPNAVEECLRHAGSVVAWRRILTVAAEVGGVRLPAGSRLLLMQSSANHDERHFENPEDVDPRRENAVEHLTFGFGAHQCLGKNLARMELQILLQELTTRLPHLELVPGQRFATIPNISFHGPQRLWVRWDPAANPEHTNPSLVSRSEPVRLGGPSRQSLNRPAVVSSVEPVADAVVRVRLVPAPGVPLPCWSPGAHLELECGEGGPTRHYSLCGDPADRSGWEFAVLRSENRRGGSEWVHTRLRAGQTVRVRACRNTFRFEPTGREVVFIAGGIGITPIMPMARQARADGLDYRLHYLGRSRTRLAFTAELAALHGDRLRLHISEEGTRAVLAEVIGPPRPGVGIYACGPASMLAELKSLTHAWPPDALHVEHFQAPAEVVDPAAEHPFTAELAASGISVAVRADQTLLDALRAAGADVLSDCAEGICGTCAVPVLAGDIDHRDLVLTRAERDSGRRLMSCCSRARGDRLVLDL